MSQERLRFDRLSAFERLQALLEEESPQSLRYACLEARLCIEALVYDKLHLYVKRVPGEVLNTWQPRAAMQALLEIEPHADKDSMLRIVQEDESGAPIGTGSVISHRALDVPTIDRYYNRFGSYLHVPTVARQRDVNWIYGWQRRLRETLEQFVEEVGPLINAAISSTLAEIIEFECAACNGMTVVNAFAAAETTKARCIHCGAEYFARRVEDDTDQDAQWMVHLNVTTFSCQECGEGTPIENRKLDVGLTFTCSGCGARHALANRQWGYGVIQENDEDVAGAGN